MNARDRRIFLQQGDCSLEAKALWCFLEVHGDKDGKHIWPSVKRLVGQTGKSKKWIEKYSKELRDTGYMDVRKRPRGKSGFSGNEYILYVRPRFRPTCVPPKTTHYQGNKNTAGELLVESEAILRALPDPDRMREDPAKYG